MKINNSVPPKELLSLSIPPYRERAWCVAHPSDNRVLKATVIEELGMKNHHILWNELKSLLAQKALQNVFIIHQCSHSKWSELHESGYLERLIQRMYFNDLFLIDYMIINNGKTISLAQYNFELFNYWLPES